MEQSKVCTKCKVKKELSSFSKDISAKGGLFSWCKECSNKQRATYREGKREYERKQRAEYRKKYPEMRYGMRNWTEENRRKWQVNNKVWYALKKGVIQKEPCSTCGEEKVHAHHEDYSKPLKVIWLCPLHHKQKHKKQYETSIRV